MSLESGMEFVLHKPLDSEELKDIMELINFPQVSLDRIDEEDEVEGEVEGTMEEIFSVRNEIIEDLYSDITL